MHVAGAHFVSRSIAKITEIMSLMDIAWGERPLDLLSFVLAASMHIYKFCLVVAGLCLGHSSP